MAYFSKDPAKAKGKELEAKHLQLDNVVARRKFTEEQTTTLGDAVRHLIRDGALDHDLEVAEGKLAAAEKRIASCITTEAEIAEEISRLEGELAAITDGKLREQTAADVEQRAVRIEKVFTTLDANLKEFVSAVGAAAELELDAAGLHLFAQNCRAEIPAAVAMISQVLRARAAATIAGTAPARLPQAPPALVPRPAPVQLESFFVLQPGTFRDANSGMPRRAPRYVTVQLTGEQAKHALAMEGVCAMDDERVQRLCRQAASQQPPEVANCQDWDTGALPTHDSGLMVHISTTGSRRGVFKNAPTKEGHFEIYQGQPLVATPAVASRSEDEDR